MKRIQLILLTMMMNFVCVAHAHPGHDHSHWMSDFLHAMFYASLAIAIGTGGYVIFKCLTRKTLK